MELSLTDDQESVRETFARCFAKEASAERVRAAEPLGFDADLWATLSAMGAVAMAVPAAAGGGGAGLLDLALLCEEQGRRLAPVPLVEGAVTARLLARFDGGCPLLPAVLDGSTIATVALQPSIDGLCRLVPAGGIAEIVLGLDSDDLIATKSARGHEVLANLGSLPIGDRWVRGPAAGEHRVLATGESARRHHEAVRTEWLALSAAGLVGIAAGALDLGVAYVKTREQFGVPIGSFQVIAHRLADIATMVDGARLLAYEAAWAADMGRPDAEPLASMAWLYGAEAAQAAAEASLHYHGGYGFMREYDIQLYYRRAKAQTLVYGDPAAEYQRLADTLYGPEGG